jgi:hypothetical protein
MFKRITSSGVFSDGNIIPINNSFFYWFVEFNIFKDGTIFNGIVNIRFFFL